MKKFLVLVLAATCLFGFSSLVKADDFPAKVKDAVTLFKQKLDTLGAAKLDGSSLYFGTTEMNGNFDIVDDVADAKGCSATIFIKKADGSFERISTNIIKEGHRAIGTKLADSSPAMAPVKDGKAYYGPADILGIKYETGYEPIKDASGAVIGIYYVGYKI